MSRIGLQAIEVPEGVEVSSQGDVVTAKGPKGEISRTISSAITMNQDGNVITFERPNDNKENRSLHGTTRSLVQNMIEGVHKGFEKQLEIVGVGYRAQKQGSKVVINAGYSHPVEMEEPEGIEIEVPKNAQIVVRGIDKELVGAVAADIRAIRLPEPYKGKGIRYQDETVRQKEGKTAK